MANETPSIGQHWRWKCDPNTKLVYIGKKGLWHQFAKVDRPDSAWCEVLSEDLRLLEAVQPPDGDAS